MKRLLILASLALTACDHDKHAGCNGARHVSDATDTGLLITIAILALLCAAIVEKWMKGDK
jgi:hypothetical protein